MCALNTAKNGAVAITVGGTVGTTVGSTIRYGTVLYGTSTGTVRHCSVRYRTVRYGTFTVWYGTVPYRTENLEIMGRGEADPI